MGLREKYLATKDGMGCIWIHRLTLLCISLLFISSIDAYGETPTLQDSLIQVIGDHSTPDSVKLEAYLNLSKSSRTSPQKALLFVRSGQEIAERIDNSTYYWRLELLKGRVFTQINDLAAAKNSIRKTLFYARKADNKVLLAKAYNFLGIFYGRLSENDSSIFCLEQARTIWEELKETKKLLDIYNNLGLAYSNQQAFATALSYYIKAFSLPDRVIGDIREQKLLSNMGLMYLRLKNYEKAEEYFGKSLKLAIKLDRNEEICLSMINLGSSLYFQERFKEAFKNLQEGTALCMKTGYNYPLARGFRYLGKIYEAQQKYATALPAYLQAARYEDQYQLALGETSSLIAQTYFQLGNNRQALKYAHEGVVLANKRGKKEYAAQACELLSTIYRAEKDYDQALKYMDLSSEYKLAAAKERMHSELLELQTQYKTKQREQELLLERKKVTEKEEEITKEAQYNKTLQILLGSLGVALAFSLAFGYRLGVTFKKLKKLNHAIQEQHEQLNVQANELKIRNQDLEKFSMALGHDLKQPLTTIKGYTALLRKTVPKLNAKELQKIGTYLHHLNKGVHRMENRIENLLKFYRTGAYMDQSQEVDLNLVLKDVQSDLHQAIEESHAHISYPQLPMVKGDPDLYAQVFQNLIANSIKYAKPHVDPEIEIYPRKNGRFWKIAVQDNGMGIEQDYLPGIFDLFSRGNAQNGIQGQGIGLAMCKRIIELHGGEIDVSSSPGLGTTFTLYIPFSRN